MAPTVVDPQPAVSGDSLRSLQALTIDYDDTLTFYLNGTKVVLNGSIDPEITLLEYLRGTGFTGTKLGCAEGGCGACTVVGLCICGWHVLAHCILGRLPIQPHKQEDLPCICQCVLGTAGQRRRQACHHRGRDW